MAASAPPAKSHHDYGTNTYCTDCGDKIREPVAEKFDEDVECENCEETRIPVGAKNCPTCGHKLEEEDEGFGI